LRDGVATFPFNNMGMSASVAYEGQKLGSQNRMGCLQDEHLFRRAFVRPGIDGGGHPITTSPRYQFALELRVIFLDARAAMFDVEWVQHPVGHGGFHTGRILASCNLQFNWVFDCGSRKTAMFDCFLKRWTTQNEEPIDWLFISHFDTDHVSGLDTLMFGAEVRNVMVPYLNEQELALQMLHEIDRGNLNRPFFELVADPATFFLGRGAQRVIFLGGGRPDGEPDADGGASEDPEDERGWGYKINPPPKPQPAPTMFRARRGREPRVQLIEGNCNITVMHGAAGLLQFKPYRAPIAPPAHRGLVAALRRLVKKKPSKRGRRPGLGDLAFAIGQHARTASGRKDLRELFRDYAGSSNRSSLSLLSVPISVLNESDNNAPFWGVDSPIISRCGRGAKGWLNTGDAELREEGDLSDWKSFYKNDLMDVFVLSLPHHGSDRNSDEKLQALCPEAILTAQVKAGAKKHPGLIVATSARERLVYVTDQAGTKVRMHFWSGPERMPSGLVSHLFSRACLLSELSVFALF
jgi:beta-lactamase superfamily II metal-dependent hydrolase